jgi:hypothetical protein
MLLALLPLAVAVAGLLIYAFATTNQKVARIGEIMFAAGLVVGLFMIEKIAKLS